MNHATLHHGSIKATVFLAMQDATGVTGAVVTDEEVCTWHAL